MDLIDNQYERYRPNIGGVLGSSKAERRVPLKKMILLVVRLLYLSYAKPNMFSIESINVNEFIQSVMRANDIGYLTEIERQMDVYTNKHEEWLYRNGFIYDLLDIRDTILLRISQLKRQLLIKKYMDVNTAN